MINCYTDAHGCVVCPAIPAVPAIPPREVNDTNLGWNAGANSDAMLDGSLHVTVAMPQPVVGAIVGLKSHRDGVGVPAQIDHGFYFFREASVDCYRIVERGDSSILSTQTRAGGFGETFEIRRSGETVYYLVDGVLLHTSRLRSTGAAVASSCLYASTDTIGTVVFETVGALAMDSLRLPLGDFTALIAANDAELLVPLGDIGFVFTRRERGTFVTNLGTIDFRGGGASGLVALLSDLSFDFSSFAAPEGGVANIGMGVLDFAASSGTRIRAGSFTTRLGRLDIFLAKHSGLVLQLPDFSIGLFEHSPLDNAFLVAQQSPGFMAIDGADNPINLLTDTVAFSESHSGQGVLALLDAIAFGGQISEIANIPVAIAVSVAFGDSVLGGAGGILSDHVAFDSSNVALALHVAALIDNFNVAATTSSAALVFGFLADTFAFDDALDIKQQILAALADGVEFGIALYTGEDTYTAWVMTTETRAMRSYSNFAFNSFAVFGGKLIGAKDDGVYVLEGDTDAGQAIDRASVRSGLLDFNTRQLKRMDRAYLGYTAEGTLALRVATTSPEGKKVEFSYRMDKPPTAEAPREARVAIGKGLVSVYWQFELDNSLDGGRFELHDVTVIPVTLSRKVR
jgi:hypothetical protein